jgi:ATP-binding cassette, subfamily B (MDR/TAP), member 1
MGYFDVPTHTPGTLTTQLSSDTTKLNGIALSMVGISVQTLATMIVAVTLGFIFDWRLALINLGCMPLMIGASVFQFKLQQGFSDVDEVIETSAGGIVSESVCNTKTIYCYNMQKKVVRMYTRILKNGMKTINKTSFVNGIAFGFSQFCMFIIYAIIFYAGGSFMYQGTLTVKSMFRAIFVLLFAGFGLGQAQQYVGDMSAARSAIVNIFNVLDEPSSINAIEISKNTAIKRPEVYKGKIEFRNVSFAYPTRPDVIVFEDLNFIIEPGQNVAFVGYSGSGKSTIIQLIERFYDPIKGQILIDDIDIRELDLVHLRHHMSLVAQEPILFKTDIIQNIKYGKLNASYEEVQKAAEQAKISKYIAPEYDKTIIPVSGGEKQRVALARAIIKDPKILLLDEATSALDSKVEREIQETLDEMMKGRTTITIAHKLSTIERSDVIYVMDHGKIVEVGSHTELYDKKGKYFHLYSAGQAELKKSDDANTVQA